MRAWHLIVLSDVEETLNYSVTPGSIDELTQVVALCRENDVEFLVIGNGSNLLVKDEGYKGVIIEVNSRISFIDVIGEDIVADAGAKAFSSGSYCNGERPRWF